MWGIVEQLREIRASQRETHNLLIKQNQFFMSFKDDVTNLLGSIDKHVTNVGVELKNLEDKINSNDQLSDQDKADLLAHITNINTNLANLEAPVVVAPGQPNS